MPRSTACVSSSRKGEPTCVCSGRRSAPRRMPMRTLHYAVARPLTAVRDAGTFMDTLDTLVEHSGVQTHALDLDRCDRPCGMSTARYANACSMREYSRALRGVLAGSTGASKTLAHWAAGLVGAWSRVEARLPEWS